MEIVKLDHDAYTSSTKNPERILIELSSPRYLGIAGSKGIYVGTVNSFLELLRIEGSSNIPEINGSFTSLDTLYVFVHFCTYKISILKMETIDVFLFFCRDQDDESSSEFSFTSSLMEALDGQGKKVHFAGVTKY